MKDNLLYRYIIVTIMALGLRSLCIFIDPDIITGGSVLRTCVIAFIVVYGQEVFGKHDDKNH